MGCARWLTGWSGHSKVACSRDCNPFPLLTTTAQSPTRLSRRSRKSSFVLEDQSHRSLRATAFVSGLNSIRRTMLSIHQTAVLQTPITTLTLPRRCVMAFRHVPRLAVVPVNHHRRVQGHTRNRGCLNHLRRAPPLSTPTLTRAKTLGHVRDPTTIESPIEILSNARLLRPA